MNKVRILVALHNNSDIERSNVDYGTLVKYFRKHTIQPCDSTYLVHSDGWIKSFEGASSIDKLRIREAMKEAR